MLTGFCSFNNKERVMDASQSRSLETQQFSRSSSFVYNFSSQNSINSLSGSPVSSSASTPRTPQSSKQENAAYTAGQSLASILNNPKLGKSGIYGNDSSWAWMFPSGSDNVLEGPPPLAPGTLPEVSMADFEGYLSKHATFCNRFIDVREHSNWEQSSVGGAVGGPEGGEDREAHGQGEGLLACLREIPPLYFDEDFALEKGATFQAACPFTTIQANMMLQEKLSHYLDLVEVHLVKEISSRSDSFFEALGQLEDLNARIVEACDQIRHLQSTVGLLDTDLVDSARRIQQANMRRSNLLALHQKLKLLSYVNHALSTLRLLVASADCAAALDVIDDMRQLLESDELVGLHCFRHLGDQLVQASESVNSMLMADFVREAIHDTSDLEPTHIMAAFQARKKVEHMAAKDVVAAEVNQAESLGEEEVKDGLREQLLPIVIGLLRTARLPAVLRAYRETLITDIKAAIKGVVNELLPLLYTGPAEGDSQPDPDGGQSLAYKLKGLTAEAFFQLLLAVFVIIQTRLKRAAEVRVVIEQIIGLEHSYAADAVTAAFASGAAQAAAQAAAAEEAQQENKGKTLTVPGGTELASSAHAVLAATSTSKQFRADVMRENTEAVCAACDAAHGRWTKLLGVRALVHPKLQLQDFVAIYDITNDFISATETVGGRLGYSIRGTLQSQSKSFVDAQHSSRLSSVSAQLDQESWVAVDALEEYQAIIDALIADSAFEITQNDDELASQGRESVGDAGASAKPFPAPPPAANDVSQAEDGNESQSQEPPSSVPLDVNRDALANGKAYANGEVAEDKMNHAGESVREQAGNETGENVQDSDVSSRAETGNGAAARQEAPGSSSEDVNPPEGAGDRTLDRSGTTAATPLEDGNQDSGTGVRLDGSDLSGVSSQGQAPMNSVEHVATGSQGTEAPAAPAGKSEPSGASQSAPPSTPARVVTDAQAQPKAAKAKVKTLHVRGQSYHAVTSALMMLKLVAEYLDIANALPTLATEVVHRIAEILKLFNTRTCQLVLGAGAMQVSGLKSITAKHLALSSQCISLFYALIGDIRRSLSVHIPDARKGLLLMEIDRVGQDYRVHRDEVHSKLVAIMKERLQVHLRSLPAIVDGWNKPDETDNLPSRFAQALTKEVGVLHRVLSPLLLESDLRSVFSRVVDLFHVQLADSFSKIETTTLQAKRRLYQDIQCVLQCLRTLPGAPPGLEENKSRELDQLLLLRFGTEAPS